MIDCKIDLPVLHLCNIYRYTQFQKLFCYTLSDCYGFTTAHTTFYLVLQLFPTQTDLFVSFRAVTPSAPADMEAAFWHWAHNTPAAHLYGIYTSQRSLRLGLYHSREQLHSLQQTMYFDDAIYPHLPQPLLDRILRIRALVDHATAVLTAALGHIDAIGQLSPRQLKGKGKGPPIVLPDPADDPTTSATQAELIHPYTIPQDTAQQNPARPTTTITPQDSTHANTTPPPVTPEFPHTQHHPQPSAPPPRPQQSYTCMRSANISPPRPVNLFPSTSPTTPSQQCDPTQIYNLHIPLRGHATLTPVRPPTAIPHNFQPAPNTPNCLFFSQHANIRPNCPEASSGPDGPWWDATGSAP